MQQIVDAACIARVSPRTHSLAQRRPSSHANREALLVFKISALGHKSMKPGSDCDLSANLDHSSSGYLEEIGGITGRPGQRNEKVILPGRHTRFCRGLQGAS